MYANFRFLASNECIDFTMMCFIFVYVFTLWGSKTASIYFNSILFDEKMNLVGAFGRSKLKSFSKVPEKKK